MKRLDLPRLRVLAAIGVVLSVALTGCGSKSKSTSAQFTASNTAAAPGLVKLVERSGSGATVIVDVAIFGPETTLDLAGFRFAIKNGNSDLVKFIPQASYSQTALIAGTGQTITIDVDGSSDPSLVQIDVEKRGGGAGNGIGGASAVVIELAFEVQGAGATTLTLAGAGDSLPVALNSSSTPVAAVTFDAASAGVMGVTTGGGGY